MRIRRQFCTFLLAACGLACGPSAWADTNLLKLRFNFDAAPVNNTIVDQLSLHPGAVQGAQWAATEGSRDGVMHFIVPAVPAVPQLTIAPSPAFDGPVGSIAFWMKSGPNSGSGNDGAILFDRRSGAGGDVIVLDNSGKLMVQSAGASFLTTQTVTNNQWRHITYVFDQSDAGGVAIYIDGVLDTSAPNARAWAWDPAQQIELGRSHDLYWRRYNGDMDDFMWYNRALTPAQVAALAAGTVDENDLATRLNFDSAPEGDVLADTSPLGDHPGANGGATWAASVGGRDGVMQFTPMPANQITVPPAAELSSPTITISFWMKSAGNTGSGNEAAIIFDRRTSAGDVIAMNDAGTLFVQATYTGGGVVNSFATQRAVNDDQWHHIAYTADQAAGSLIQIYIDGVLDTAQAHTAAWFWPASQQIELGTSHDPYWRKYSGFLDDFQIYNQVLTAEQIQFIADAFGPGAILPDPLISVHPQSALVALGTPANLSVTATGTGALSYQWQKGGTELAGKTSATLSIPSAALTDAGVYRCVVTSSVGQSISLEATLSVAATAQLALSLYPGMNLTGTVGAHYRVEYAEALTPGTWLTLTNIAALPASPFFVLDPQAATHPSRFYRALLLP